MCQKDDRAFLERSKNVTNSKIKPPSKIGEAHGSVNITSMCREHYAGIFNMANGSKCSDLYTELCNVQYEFDISMYVNPNEIDEIIKEIPCNKSPGLDGIKHATNQLSVLLAVLVSAILVHRHRCLSR